jgi:hypothetical protein
VADLLKDLEDYLIGNSLATGDANDIFRDFMPDTPSNLIVVSEYAGTPGNAGVDTQVRSIQIKVRNTSYALSRSKAHAIYNLLHKPEDQIIYFTPTRWAICYPRQTPFQMERDEQGKITFGFNLAVTTYND